MQKDIFSRELRASQDFALGNHSMLDILYSSEDSTILNIYSQFSDAVEHYGYAEMHFRQSERNLVAKRFINSQKEIATIANRFNSKGGAILTNATASLKTLIAQVQKEPAVKPKNLIQLDNFVNDFLDIVTLGEMKPADVEKINTVLQTCVEIAKKGGDKEVLNYAQMKFAELIEVRRSTNRGAVDNIPVWKMVAIAAFLAIAFFLVWRCLAKGKGCDVVERLAKGMGKTILTLIISLC